jgi:hypothetical protein
LFEYEKTKVLIHFCRKFDTVPGLGENPWHGRPSVRNTSMLGISLD